MSVHYEIEWTVPSDTKSEPVRVLVQGLLDVEWTSRKNCAAPYYFKPREFPTRGGARNYIHKYGLNNCQIVRVPAADTKE